MSRDMTYKDWQKLLIEARRYHREISTHPEYKYAHPSFAGEAALEYVADKYGVGYGTGGWASGPIHGITGNVVASYINMGDTYDMTLCFIVVGDKKGKFIVSSCGDLVEKYEYGVDGIAGLGDTPLKANVVDGLSLLDIRRRNWILVIKRQIRPSSLLEACLLWDGKQGGTFHQYAPRLAWEKGPRRRGDYVYYLTLDNQIIGYKMGRKKDLYDISPYMHTGVLDNIPIDWEYIVV